jgi:hypothetical protein
MSKMRRGLFLSLLLICQIFTSIFAFRTAFAEEVRKRTEVATVARIIPIKEGAGAHTTCLRSGSEVEINAALQGAGAAAVLCPGALFTLNNPVVFTASNQKLYTKGLPTGGSRAILRINNDGFTTAIRGIDQSGIVIQNIQVDGNRSAFGYLSGDALILIGGRASDQTVSNVRAYGTRSWSTIHIFEGHITDGVPHCQNANISNNTLGPAGTPDGFWADGISLACGNSTVENNEIIDATDGAIVVFGAPGSVIQNNYIVAATQDLLGGINMVDYNPTGGNYTGTQVRDNTIDARGALIRVGIAMGPAVWFCSESINFGGTVADNVLQGIHFGFGYAVNGVSNWTVTGNSDFSRHVGVVGVTCGNIPSQPAGYQYQSVTSSTLQSEFVPASLNTALGVSEPGILRVIQPTTRCGYARADQGLVPGQNLYSCNRRFYLSLRPDGNLVLYQREPFLALWATGTIGLNTAQAIMQGNGNLVLHDTTGQPVWESNTAGHPGAFLRIRNDGNLVIYTSSGSVIWSSGTD